MEKKAKEKKHANSKSKSTKRAKIHLNAMFPIIVLAILVGAQGATIKLRGENSKARTLAGLIPDTEIPGAGYGCERELECEPGDPSCRKYILKPSIRTFSIKNSAKFFNTSEDVEFMTRTWEAELEGSDFNTDILVSACGNFTNQDWILGPCIEAVPGGKVLIKLENKLDVSNLGKWWVSTPPTPEEYLALAQPGQGAYADLKGFEYKNKPLSNLKQYGLSERVWRPGQEWNYSVAGKAGFEESVRENMPGADTTFQRVNIHLHGMEVAPHLFHPMGTSNPLADWIETIPEKELTIEQRAEGLSPCYSYNFTIPKDHPGGGTYWYHTHRHGAVAMQTWSGMAGLIIVPGSSDEELKVNYNIDKEFIFVIWDPHVVKTVREGQADLVQVGGWLDNQNNENVFIPFLVNNEYQPTFEMIARQTARFRVLCATTENLCGFRIVRVPDGRSEDEVCGNGFASERFYNFGSDGIIFSKPVEKELLILGGGQREELLVNLERDGTYVVCQEGLDSRQFFGTGPANTTLAMIKVQPSTESFAVSSRDPTSMHLTPGIPVEDYIDASNIKATKSLVFGMDSDVRNFIPFPQFRINDNKYTVKSNAMEEFFVGEAEEFVIYNSQLTVHPFHIHVNAFQVQEVNTAFEPGSEFSRYLIDQAKNPNRRWRDTVLVPPQGYVRIWIRAFNHFMGKTAFHCHFLAHEDTGMISNMMITFNMTKCVQANAEWAGSCNLALGQSIRGRSTASINPNSGIFLS